MHTYLQAIGFKQVRTKKQYSALIQAVLEAPDSAKAVPQEDNSRYTVITKDIADDIGIVLCGVMENENTFEMEYVFPYIKGKVPTAGMDCEVKRLSDKEAYSGVCDDMRLGLNLIFYLNNFIDYKNMKRLLPKEPEMKQILLSGLSLEGKILLPIEKTKEQIDYVRRQEKRSLMLMEAAKKGDEEAIEDLAVQDMNLYNQLSRIVQEHDMYSVIETFFIPSGVECDQYSIMGYIDSVQRVQNSLSGETIVILDLRCNEMPLRVCIQEEDLLGIPAKGFRFKGDIWLQGYGVWK